MCVLGLRIYSFNDEVFRKYSRLKQDKIRDLLLSMYRSTLSDSEENFLPIKSYLGKEV